YRPIKKQPVKTYTYMSGEPMPIPTQFIYYPLARIKVSIVRTQINPALYPNILYVTRSWDTF
ncbi:hypothetical protein ACPTHI_15430, partial [Enterococcus faecalis]